MDTQIFGHTCLEPKSEQDKQCNSTAKSLHPPSLEICFSIVILLFGGSPFPSSFAFQEHKAEQLCLSEELCPQQMLAGIPSALRKHSTDILCPVRRSPESERAPFPAQDGQRGEFTLLISLLWTLCTNEGNWSRVRPAPILQHPHEVLCTPALALNWKPQPPRRKKRI